MGLKGLGESLAGTADALFRIEEQRGVDETKRLETAYQVKESEVRRRVRETRGVETEGALVAGLDELSKFQSELIATAKHKVAKNALPDLLGRRLIQTQDALSEYALVQGRVAKEAASIARAETSLDTALDFEIGSAGAEDNLGTALAEVAEMYAYQGENVVAQKQMEYRSRYHGSRVSQLFSSEKPEEAQAYIDTHVGEMTAGDEAQARALIRGELLANRDSSDLALIVAGGGAGAPEKGEPAPPPGESRWRPPIRQHTVTVPGGQMGAPRSYGGHTGRDYAGVAPGTPVYPMAEGVVRKVYRTKGGGNTVEIDYPGGYRSTYKHLADGSTARLKVGDTVDADDQVGAVGNTGTASHGPHLHGELIGPDGKRVDPARMTNKPAPRAPTPDGRRVDLATMYERIDAQPWSESRKRRAKNAVQQFAGENDQVKQRDQHDAEEAISRKLVEIEKGGGKLTKLSQLPADAIKRARPEYVQQLLGTIEANNRPEPPAAHDGLAVSLKIIAATDPEEFKKIDLRPLQGQMTPGEFESLAVDQAKMRSAPADVSPLANIRTEIDTTIRRNGKPLGWDIDKQSTPEKREQYSRMTDLMRTYLQNATEGKRKPTDDELDAAFDYATEQVTVRKPGIWGESTTTKRRFEVPGIERVQQGGTGVRIPNDVLARIKDTYRQAYGRDPSPTVIVEIYTQNKGKAGFWR